MELKAELRSLKAEKNNLLTIDNPTDEQANRLKEINEQGPILGKMFSFTKTTVPAKNHDASGRSLKNGMRGSQAHLRATQKLRFFLFINACGQLREDFLLASPVIRVLIGEWLTKECTQLRKQ